MGDYILDFRKMEQSDSAAERALLFFPDLEIDRIQTPRFDLMLTRSGRAGLWAPYISPGGTTVALAGRIALDPVDWEKAESVPGDGGLACKAIYTAFAAEGFAGIQKLNGAYAVHVFEPAKKRHSVILDPAGCYPSYRPKDLQEAVLSSHPDALAIAINGNLRWDYGSFAAFLATGQVSHPYTYYNDVEGLEHGTRYIFDLSHPHFVRQSSQKFAASEFHVTECPHENQLADELANAVSRASKQITQPRMGKTFIALSGGLDSRLIASQAIKHKAVYTFSIRGAKVNNEFRTANSIATALGLEMMPMIRSFDHYADNAEMGVRISGGMGSIASNHFLGFRKMLRELGCDNLVTGCYFDYLFKSLAIDCEESRWLRREQLTDYHISSYLPYIPPIKKYKQIVEERLDGIAPGKLTTFGSDDIRLRIMARRTFPLWREGDNIQRLVAQRVFDWYSPAVFREILDVYWRTGIAARLNKHLFKKVVLKSIPPELRSIPDNNTELPIDAPPFIVSVFRYRVALRRLISRRSHKIDTQEAWLNWGYYARQSDKIRGLWCRTQQNSRQLIEDVTGQQFSDNVEDYLTVSPDYFFRLLTLKLWMEQRK
jgi:asparagine synthase (glutamine-hydrolysing)